MFYSPNYTRRTAEALNTVAVHRNSLKVFKANPVLAGSSYEASAKASMRCAIELARYWRERNKVKLP